MDAQYNSVGCDSSTLDASIIPDEVFVCNSQSLSIEFTTTDTSNIISIASLGILSNCDCSLTSFDP